MAVFRVKKTRDYTVMANHHLRNKALSLKAKGLLSLMLSLPDDWDYTLKGLARICRDGVDSIAAAVNELEEAGYIVRKRVRDDKGRVRDMEYTILEHPKEDIPPKLDFPVQDNPVQEKPEQEKRPQLSTKESNIQQSSTEESIPILSNQMGTDEMLKREQYRELLKENIEYDKLLQAIKNTIPALAEAIESLREKMIVFRYQVRHILSGKEHIEKNLKILQPELTRYIRIAEQIKEKSNERKTLLAEKKAAPIIQILKHRELSRRIAELTEDLEELRSEKALILQSLQYTEDTGVDVIRKDISTMEAGLKRLDQQEQKYTAELDNALKEYAELKEQAAEFDADELMSERLDIRPGKERSAASRVQSAYGDRYQPLMMYDAKRDVSQMMGEEMEARSIRERLHRKQQPKTQQQKNPKHHEQKR